MNARLAALLTGAHAPAWRRRYGTEFCALLEELPATPAIVASATTSALSSQAPGLVTIGAFVLAAAVLALGPAASDHRSGSAQAHTTRAVHAGLSCVAYDAANGSVGC